MKLMDNFVNYNKIIRFALRHLPYNFFSDSNLSQGKRIGRWKPNLGEKQSLKF